MNSIAQKANVLIVDDELGPRESLKMILGPYYNIYTAERGAQAIEIVDRQPIDLVTVDLKMPGLPGMKVLEKIKERDPDIEVIIITGYGSMETAIEGLRLCAFDYIAKPFDTNFITALVQQALERRNARMKLRELKADFLANTSHEFRTPLSIIMGYISLLLDRMIGELSQEQHQVLEKVYQNTEEFLDLIDNVLCLSSINGGNHALLMEEIALDDFIQQNLPRYEKAAKEKGLRVWVRLPEMSIRFQSDLTKLGRIFRNLLHNAVKFTIQGEISIRAIPSPQWDSIDLEIKDTGVGINPSEVETVFQPFWQSDSSSRRQFPGLGVGLTVARRLTDLLGGKIEIKSQPGVGTHVILSIPCQLESGKESAPIHEMRVQNG